jgi:DNA segregation ATPase FtsK/SpoIIIE, S-DNA-T family
MERRLAALRGLKDMRPNNSAAYATRDVRQGMNGFLWRQAEALAGVLLMAGVLAAIASLGTWSVADPSFSHATGNTPVNALGYGGAIFADLAMQFFGLAIVPALVPILIAGFLMARGRGFANRSRRALSWIAGAMLMAAVFASFNPPVTWPLPVGIGGVLGDLILKIPGSLSSTGYPQGIFAALTGLLLAGPALWFLAYSGSMIGKTAPAAKPQRKQAIEEEEDLYDDEDEGGFLALGALAHYWYTLRGHAGRALGSMFDRRKYDDDMFAGSARPAKGGSRRQPAVNADDDYDDFDDVAPAPRLRQEPEFSYARQGSKPVAADDDDFDDVMPDAPAPRMVNAGQSTAINTQAMRVDASVARPKPGARITREAQGSLLREGGFVKPPLHLLGEPKNVVKDASLSKDALEQNARNLEGVLDDFGVRGEIIQVRPGPVVTLYELEPAPGIKSSRVIGLADDIARSMSAIAARVAVVPGRNAIGIELPNQRRETVFLREILASQDFESSKAKLGLALGKTINGEAVVADLAKMPHVLVAGTTGSGKSVAINTMIMSLVYKMTPKECRLIMIDPKMLELSVYDGIPHLLTPVVTDPKKAVVALKWTVKEMEDRYRKMSKVGVRNIDGYNLRVAQADQNGEQVTRTVQTGFDRHTGEAMYETETLDMKPMPYIVVIIDEMADLMMVAGKDIEGAVQRLAQMARAAGIHVIMATQRPSVDVITGTIKANFPTRISFQVTSKIDSRTILGEMGAEQLLGQGDMLYMAGGGRIQRVHGPFVSDEEVEKIVAHLKLQGAPEYLESITQDDEDDEDGDGDGPMGTSNLSDSDDPYDQAVSIVLRDKKASTSYIQRRMGIGYNRAASLIERMEQEGIVGPANQTGKRDILVPTEDDMM